MTESIVVVGAGGFGREVLNLIRAINEAVEGEPRWSITGVIDDSPSDKNLAQLDRQSVGHLGGVTAVLSTSAPSAYVIGIGSSAVRRTIADRLDAAGWTAATLVHPDATVGSGVELGEGSVICAGARLTTNIRTGRHCHVDTNATVGHDSVLGDFVRLNPASSVSGDCTIDDDVLVGVGAVILNQLRVGRNATVGGGACVVREVHEGTVVKGVPAR